MSGSTPRRETEISEPASPGATISGVYIQQAASVVGTTATSIRTWERYGLVRPQRSQSGYRIYTAEDIERLRQVRRLLDEGVNPRGVAVMLNVADHAVTGKREAQGERLLPKTVGSRIYGLRKHSGLSLRQLADRTGLSPSYISSVERSLSSPSIASLRQLAAALQTDIPALMGAASSVSGSPVVRRGQRDAVYEGGVSVEDLSTDGSNLEPLIMRVAPGAGSSGAYQHEGEEFLLLLNGELTVTLGGVEQYELKPGDAMTFSSSRSHSWTNVSATEAVVLWVNTPRTF